MAKNQKRKRGKRLTVSYKGLHRQIHLLERKLGEIRKVLNRAGLSTSRVDFVLGVLDDADGGTGCQKTMLETF